MTTEEIIIHIFCYVDDHLPQIQKHTQAKLYPSELVTIGILFAIKGGHFLKRDFDSLFGGLPSRTRLLRLFKTHQAWCDALLASESFFTVIDTYPIELLFPIRYDVVQSKSAKKGKIKAAGLLASSSAGSSMSKAVLWLGISSQPIRQTST